MHDLKPNSLLSRFLLRRHRKHINFERKAIKSSLFTEKHPKGFSVFCIDSLKEARVCAIAQRYVATNPDDPLVASCTLETEYYEKAELKIDKSTPPQRHYNIHGMPVGSDMEEARKLSLRQMLVANSKLVLLDR